MVMAGEVAAEGVPVELSSKFSNLGENEMTEFNLGDELSNARRHFVSLGSGLTVHNYRDEVVKYFKVLIDREYTRERLYLIANGLSKLIDELPEDLTDMLRDYETGLTGHVARESITRLSPNLNEPTNPDDFVAYVRNRRWTKDPNIRPVN
jgi:hypothetical protein